MYSSSVVVSTLHVTECMLVLDLCVSVGCNGRETRAGETSDRRHQDEDAGAAAGEGVWGEVVGVGGRWKGVMRGRGEEGGVEREGAECVGRGGEGRGGDLVGTTA